MPTLEQFSLMLDAVQNLKTLRANIKDNAELYQKKIDAGQKVGDVKTIIGQDLDQYVRRLDWHAAADVSGDVSAAASALGVSDLDKEISELTSAVDSMRTALVTDDLQTLTVAADSLADRKVFFKPQG